MYENTVVWFCIAKGLGVWVFGCLGGVVGDTGKAEMPSGSLAFATRRVELMAASMRAELALCGGKNRPEAPVRFNSDRHCQRGEP